MLTHPFDEHIYPHLLWDLYYCYGHVYSLLCWLPFFSTCSFQSIFYFLFLLFFCSCSTCSFAIWCMVQLLCIGTALAYIYTPGKKLSTPYMLSAITGHQKLYHTKKLYVWQEWHSLDMMNLLLLKLHSWYRCDMRRQSDFWIFAKLKYCFCVKF